MRLEKEQLNKLKEKFGVDRIWSFSRISTFLNCKWEYKYLYIDHNRSGDNVYTIFGTECHELIQDYLDHKLTKDEMRKKWQDFVENWEADPSSLQFDTDKIKSGYLNNLSHYFTNTDDIGYEVKNEKPVLINLKDQKGKPFVFVGYIDSEYEDENKDLHIVDFKTSSKSSFSPKNLPKKSMQLILYAIGEHQRTGLPYDKIHCKFDMQKYCKVHYQLESGKWKSSIQERSEWVYKMSSKLKTKLPKVGIDPIEVDEMIIEASNNNNMDNLPEEVKKQFYITNYYIDIKLTDKICQELIQTITKYCNEILQFEQKEDIDTFLEVNEPYDPNNYYCKKLCAYHTSKGFKQQEGLSEDLLESIQDDINIFDDDQNEDADEDILKALLA